MPKWAPDFSAQIQPNDELPDPQIFVQDQPLALPAPGTAPALPSRARISTTQPTTSASLQEEEQTTFQQAVNDDEEKAGKPVRKRRSRRKPKRDDRRRCQTTLTISQKDYRAGMTVWNMAPSIDLALDALVTLRPFHMDGLSMPARHAWWKGRLKSLGQWFNDNDLEFAALWSREARREGEGRKLIGTGEHLHMLLHLGDQRDAFEKMLRKSLKHPREVDVRPATPEVIQLDCGWRGDAGTYVLKAVHQNEWKTYRTTPHRPSGPIYGARCGWTNNLDALLKAQ